MAGEIVIGCDGSPGSSAALPYAIELAQTFDVPLVLVFAYGQNPVGGRTGDLKRAVEDLGAEWLDEARDAALAAAPGLTVERELVDGRAAESLVLVADRLGARMIVVGANGFGQLVNSIVGSVTSRVLQDATVPVLVVPPAEN